MGNLSSIQSPINNSANELLQILAFQLLGLTCLLPPELFQGEFSAVSQMLMTLAVALPVLSHSPQSLIGWEMED